MPRMSLTAKAFTFGLALVVTCIVVNTAQAQRNGTRGGRAPEDMVTLAANEQVQKELSVTDEQKPKITKIAEDYREEIRPLTSGLRDLSSEERDKKIAEIGPK